MWNSLFSKDCLQLLHFQVPPLHNLAISSVSGSGTSLVKASPNSKSSVSARVGERRGPPHIPFQTLSLFSASHRPLAFRGSFIISSSAFPGLCGMNGLASPLNLFVESVRVCHPDAPFLMEILISQRLEVFSDEGSQLSFFPGIGPG